VTGEARTAALRLVIGSKTYSSWSLRPWLLLRQLGIAFEEVVVPFAGSWREEVRRLSPSGRVPVLHAGDLVIWDSLAICEYAAEQHGGWPADARRRARARSVAAEMHSGFGAVRQELPQNLRVRGVAPADALTATCRAEIARIDALWSECLRESGGRWLFGEFGIADAMFAPVALRFTTYGVALGGEAAAYAARIEALPAVRAWIQGAQLEPEEVPEAEARARQLGLQHR
jgi:glutathione S-transferase